MQLVGIMCVYENQQLIPAGMTTYFSLNLNTVFSHDTQVLKSTLRSGGIQRVTLLA